MSRVSVPWELTPLHLLELQDVTPALADQLRHSAELVSQGDLTAAQRAVDQLLRAASARRDRYVGALGLVLGAELFRRLARWEDCLDAIRRGLHWLESRVSPVARYNEGVAVYLEGIAHYVLGAEEKVAVTFAYAQETLSVSERHWGFEHSDARAADCRNVIRWMRRLMELRDTAHSGDVALVVPVYEVVNRTAVRTDAAAIPLCQVTIPSEVLAKYAPSEITPILPDAVTVLTPRPYVQYAAIRITQDGPDFGREGDLLVVEITGSGLSSGELVLTSDTPFVRRDNGRVELRSSARRSVLGMQLAGSGLMGIPRVLIREGGGA